MFRVCSSSTGSSVAHAIFVCIDDINLVFSNAEGNHCFCLDNNTQRCKSATSKVIKCVLSNTLRWMSESVVVVVAPAMCLYELSALYIWYRAIDRFKRARDYWKKSQDRANASETDIKGVTEKERHWERERKRERERERERDMETARRERSQCLAICLIKRSAVEWKTH